MLTVDLDAVAANYHMLCRQLAGVECGAVVKADAYGLGIAPVARRLAAEGCRRFFVASLDEGVALRDILAAAAPEAAIYVFDGVRPGAEAAFDAHALVPVLGDPHQIDRWAAHGRADGGRRAVVKIDSGMGRMGLSPPELSALADAPQRLDGLTLDLVMSHLACADEAENPMNADQLTVFEAARARLPPASASLANSAGIFLGPAYHFDLARPGAAIYGIWNSPDRPNPMAQVVRLQGKIMRLRDVDRDMAVGYGATRRIVRGRRLATVAIGYADGYPRALSNHGVAHVGDVEVPVVGRISMDFATFDVTGVPADRLHAGDDIDLIGPRHSTDSLAHEAGTIGYEILAGLGSRVRRVYLGEAT